VAASGREALVKTETPESAGWVRAGACAPALSL